MSSPLPIWWHDLRHFSPSEFAPHAHRMDEVFMRALDEARDAAGVPFKITSHYDAAGEGLDREGVSAHKLDLCPAVDIAAADSRTRFQVVAGLLTVGFSRIGIYDKHIHVDSATLAQHPRFVQRVMWLGESQ